MSEQHADFLEHFRSSSYEEDVIGVSGNPEKNVWGTLVVYVTLETDLTDANRYPDSWGGIPITYHAMPWPVAYHGS